MSEVQDPRPTAEKTPLRLLPGVVLVSLQWLVKLLLPVLFPDLSMQAMLGSVALGLAVIVWWLFFSRARWSERLGGLGLIVVAMVAVPYLLDESIRTAGMGIVFYILAVPTLCLALVAGAVASRYRPAVPRLAAVAAAVLVACGSWLLLRTDGIDGDGNQDFTWRWATSAEDRLLAGGVSEETGRAGRAAALGSTEPEWPGFRGPRRDGVIPGLRLATDWSASPPAEMWRRPIGPGWSSFAVHGDRLYTQEQLGEHEIVTCYDRATGEPVWRHRDAVRFWESHAGAGPRATPALHGGRVYSFGATGILNALDAADGSVVWSRDTATDTEAEVPHWGFTSSPLVVGDVVVVDTGTLVAYDLADGSVRWRGPTSWVSYSSPQLVTLGGTPQILMLGGPGAVSVSPADGSILWEHEWRGASIVQPAVTGDGDLLITASSSSGGVGTRRLAVDRGASGWEATERWTSNGLKPYFSDFVVHEGHAYGFDGNILSCIGLDDGKRRWKGGRYGHGQMLLLPDQDLLLVVTEKGDLALVQADPSGFTELARHRAAIQGKSWTHPVVVGDLLLVRNAEEMAAFRLTRASG